MWGWSGQDQLGSSYMNSKGRPSISGVPVLWGRGTFVKHAGRMGQILHRCVQVLRVHLFPWRPSAFFFLSPYCAINHTHTWCERKFYKPQPTHSQLLKSPGSRWQRGGRWGCRARQVSVRHGFVGPLCQVIMIESMPWFHAKKVFKAAQTYILWWNQKHIVKFTVLWPYPLLHVLYPKHPELIKYEWMKQSEEFP